MEKEIPSYLKLHVDPTVEAAPPKLLELPGLSDICRAFEGATGWQLQLTSSLVDDRTAVWSSPIPSGTAPSPGAIALKRCPSAVSRQDALQSLETVRPLATAMTALVGQIWQMRYALWQREAELAAGVPVVPHAQEAGHLAERLEAVLRGGAEALGCEAAGLYLLDDDTSHLKLRAVWGLPAERLLEPPRPLRGALADLEALVGHAVALEDVQLLPHWRVPEPFAAALCVPVSTPTIPVGTLWFFADRARPFTSEQTQLAEIVAGRVAADLERDVLLRQGVRTKQLERELHEARRWQQLRLPAIAPLLDDWQVSGCTVADDELSGSFHDWSILSDGTLALVVADCHRLTVDAALTAATVLTAVRAHLNYRHSPERLVEHVNETLWSASPGDWPVSLFCGAVQPEQGEFAYCATGRLQAFLVGAGQVRSLLTGTAAVGVELEQTFQLERCQLERGECLVIITAGPQEMEQPTLQQPQLVELVGQHGELSAKHLLERLCQLLQAKSAGGSVLVVKRVGR